MTIITTNNNKKQIFNHINTCYVVAQYVIKTKNFETGNKLDNNSDNSSSQLKQRYTQHSDDENLSDIDGVFYDTELGAAGDGKSLQKIDGVWQALSPTPGEFTFPIAENEFLELISSLFTTCLSILRNFFVIILLFYSYNI